MGIEDKLPSGLLLTTVEQIAGLGRKASMWPATFGLACCAIEMMAVGTPDYDLARFGMERFAATPRQADLMIVAGRVSQKMAPVVRQVYDQMAEPKWVISMGVCASSGGMFNNYAIVQGVDHIIPVDIYLPGCPPRPQMLPAPLPARLDHAALVGGRPHLQLAPQVVQRDDGQPRPVGGEPRILPGGGEAREHRHGAAVFHMRLVMEIRFCLPEEGKPRMLAGERIGLAEAVHFLCLQPKQIQILFRAACFAGVAAASIRNGK